MKKSFSSSRSNSFDGQFISLNNSEMFNLRGGDTPPLPPPSGEDFPIDLLKKSLNILTISTQELPLLTTTTTTTTLTTKPQKSRG